MELKVTTASIIAGDWPASASEWARSDCTQADTALAAVWLRPRLRSCRILLVSYSLPSLPLARPLAPSLESVKGFNEGMQIFIALLE